MTHNELYRNALDAINNLFADQSVPTSEMVKDLETLKLDIEILIDSVNMPSTSKNEEDGCQTKTYQGY